MHGNRWDATDKRLAQDIRHAVRRELDPKKRPKRTEHDFERIRSFLEDVVGKINGSQLSDWDQSEHIRQSFASFMNENFNDSGKKFCPVRLNFCSTRNEERKRQKKKEREDMQFAALVENAKKRRKENPLLVQRDDDLPTFPSTDAAKKRFPDLVKR